MKLFGRMIFLRAIRIGFLSFIFKHLPPSDLFKTLMILQFAILLVKQHIPALLTFGPKVIGCYLRKNEARVDSLRDGFTLFFWYMKLLQELTCFPKDKCFEI